MSALYPSLTAGRERVLVTPEGIAMKLVVASRGARFGALALDLAIIAMLQIGTTLLLFYIAGGVFELGTKALEKSAAGSALQFLVILWFAAMFLFRNAYFMFFELGPRGATWGKRAAGIRIASRDGGRLTPEMVLARNLLRDIELFLPISFLLSASGGDMGAAGIAAVAWFLVFVLFPCFNKDALRAGDLIAGTWVVEAPRRRLESVMSTTRAAQEGTSVTTGAAYRFGEKELAVYGEYELQTLERVLRENRHEALVTVHEAICRKIGWDPGAGDEYAFLEAYYAQLRARLERNMRMGVRKADKWG
ncbi:RDD family protein [Novosphingobium sp. TH158]|uniref:RDD family protein n=1 Tax=Novosphingobium sp. TH158 TaxID=2067455 RepID=UPI000C7A9EF0|nr:RDD family protein [Novosphingobium sp. TH158]PLK27303.1 RDD family protein [Novosphingobium sp. TH158]